MWMNDVCEGQGREQGIRTTRNSIGDGRWGDSRQEMTRNGQKASGKEHVKDRKGTDIRANEDGKEGQTCGQNDREREVDKERPRQKRNGINC
jgi:hypothetical protein